MPRVKLSSSSPLLGLIAFAAACTPGSEDPGDDTGTGDTGSMCVADGDALDVPAPSPTSCEAEATDYAPGQEDAWPACVTDDREYHLVADTPSSIARVLAYIEIVDILSDNPSPDDFTAARTIYGQDEGLESRVLRREDLRYPAIPESDWDPGVDADKQCTVLANIEKYPERCVGPAQIAPILDEAFAAGQSGEGDPVVHAARIEAALLWFLYVSVYKEANTCLTSAAKDCDSAWAYYTAGANREGGEGLAAEIRRLSPLANDSIWDGILAFRCIRDLYPEADYPTLEDVPAEGQDLLADAQTQLVTALDYGWVQIVRERLQAQPALCGAEAEANWASLQIAGPQLALAGEEADADAWAELAALWERETPPDASELERAIMQLDALFSCP